MDPSLLEEALKKSYDAFQRSAAETLSKFLSDTNPMYLFLMNYWALDGVFLLTIKYEADHFLFQYLPAKCNWGVDAVLLDLSDAERMEYLRAAANFTGSLYLHNICLSKEEAREWWKALRSSLTPPKSLTLSSNFYKPDESFYNCGLELLDAVNMMNGKMEKVVVCNSDLQFVEFFKPICLRSFTLRNVGVHNKFLDQLAQGGYGSITSLSLCDLKSARSEAGPRRAYDRLRWNPSFANFLKGNLKSLTLVGFFGLQSRYLIAFMKALEHNSCLESLDLQRCSGFETTEVVGAIVDALHKSGLLHLNVDDTDLQDNAAIKAQLGRNQAKHHQTLKSYEKVPATSARLFICGDAYAGKTTLVTSLVTALRTDFLHRVKSYIPRKNKFQRKNLERTRGIEVRELARDGIRVSMWDMAGQAEFHAFHDHIFPDPSAQGSPALFLFVWSPIDSRNVGMGKQKTADAFKTSFCYWLKFITSKIRQSNMTQKVIIVLTRKDQMDHVYDSVATSLAVLMNTFQKIVQVVGVWEVDAHNFASVKVVASSIFQTAKDVLKDVQVYKVCSEFNTYLTSGDFDPILPWEDFQKLCQTEFGIEKPDVQRAIASSLHESGHLIYLHSMPFLILDTNWFCHEVMGDLVRFSGPHASGRTMPFEDGFVPHKFLEKLLEESTGGSIKGAHLVDLMESMQLCCKVPNDTHSRIFIPTMLSNNKTSKILCWRGEHGDAKFFYVGRRLQCRHKDIAFLTPGLFPLIQVVFYKAFCKIGADVLLGKDVISIWYQGMEIIMEFCEALGEHVIDVLVRSPDDVDQSVMLKLVEEKVIKTLITMCAQPIGNQGVELVCGIIRPLCLKLPAASHEREDQCVLMYQLKEDLRRQLQESLQQGMFRHTWKHNLHFGVGADSILDLLGFEEFWEVVKSYESTLEEVAKELAFQEGTELRNPVHGRLGEIQESLIDTNTEIAEVSRAPAGCSRGSQEITDGGQALMDVEGLNNQSMDTICQGMASILQEVLNVNLKVGCMSTKLDGIDTKLDGIGTKLDSMHKDLERIATLQGRVLPDIQRRVKQILYFGREEVAGTTPRLCFLSTGKERRLVTALIKDVKNVRIELFCEHREAPHRVDNEEGICVTTLSDGAIKKAIPYVNGFLRLLTLAAKVGAHALAGAGSMVPDYSQITALLLDTPGLLDNQSDLSQMEATTTSSTESGAIASFMGWQEWLVSVLERNGGMTESNIARKFKLRRALYHDTSQVAWLCATHYKLQRPFPLL